MPAHKCLHATCHTPLHQDGRSFDGKQMQIRMRALCVLLRFLFVYTRTCLLKLRPRLPHIMCVEGHPLADMSPYKHVFLNHCTTVEHAEPRQPAALHEVPYQSMSRYVVTWRSRTSVCQCSGVQHAATTCQVCVRVVTVFKAGVFPKTSDVMQCQMTSYHDSACGDFCLAHHLIRLCRTTGITDTRGSSNLVELEHLVGRQTS